VSAEAVPTLTLMPPFQVDGRRPDASSDAVVEPAARQYVDEAQRLRIVRATAVLACERGLESVTVSGITGRARVSRQSFYRLFRTREECLAAVLEEAVAHATVRAGAAYDSRDRWVDRVRAALFALLELSDEQPELAELCVLTAVAAPRAQRAYRKEILDAITAILEEGREEPRALRNPSPLAGEAAIGGVLAVLYRRLLHGERQALVELLNPLMAILVLPYLGGAAAADEMRRPAPQAAARVSRGHVRQPPMGLDIRLTYRTMRVLTTIAAQADLSNLEVSQRAGITDQGQVSKLLARLAGVGLIENTGTGYPNGSQNAWRLTPRGIQLEWMFGREGATKLGSAINQRSLG
jgi:AcrR family transcriptional regulator